jgi:hypothetical protein
MLRDEKKIQVGPLEAPSMESPVLTRTRESCFAETHLLGGVS